jgi:hypothetical protein
VEDEIVKRADTEQTTFVVGEWQLDIDSGYQRKWDVDDIEPYDHRYRRSRSGPSSGLDP